MAASQDEFDCQSPARAAPTPIATVELQPRVLSLSPQHCMGVNGEEGSELPALQATTQRMGDLLDHANRTVDQLQAMMTRQRDHAWQADEASVHLQERLRLSAQMLKAFESQLGRVETSLMSLNQVQQQMEQRLAGFEAAIQAVLANFMNRFEQCALAATGRLEHTPNVEIASANDPVASTDELQIEQRRGPVEIPATRPLRLANWSGRG